METEQPVTQVQLLIDALSGTRNGKVTWRVVSGRCYFRQGSLSRSFKEATLELRNEWREGSSHVRSWERSVQREDSETGVSEETPRQE